MTADLTVGTRAPAPPGLLYVSAEQFQRRLDERDALTAYQLRTHLGRAETNIYAALEALQEKRATALAAGKPVSPAWLYQEARYRELLATVDQELARFGTEAAQEITDAQRWAIGQGGHDAEQLGASAAGVRAGDFLGVNPDNIRAVAGFVSDGTPLTELFSQMGIVAGVKARNTLVQAVTMGWGADKLAREFRRNVTDLAGHRATTIARTELHRVYRSTSRDVYAANADVLQGWAWMAKLDARTCPACIAMHGTLHSVTDTLDGHPRCRCAMVPISGEWGSIDGVGDLPPTTPTIQPGAEWLKAQDPGTQDAILGRTKGALMRAGQIDVQDLVKRTDDAAWGTMRREATLAEARAAAKARGVRQRVSKTTRKPDGRTRRKTATEKRREADAIKAKERAAADELAALRAENARLKAELEAAQLRTQQRPTPRALDTDNTLVGETQAKLTTFQEGLERAKHTAKVVQQNTLIYKAKAADDKAWRPTYLKSAKELKAAHARVKAFQKAVDDYTWALSNLKSVPDLDWVDDLPKRTDTPGPNPGGYLTDADKWEGTNPRNRTEPDMYSDNCTRVSATWELRQRGHDVTAAGTPVGTSNGVTQTLWRDADGNPRAFQYLDDAHAVRAAAEAYGPGARGFVTVEWNQGGAHIWNWYVDVNGDMKFVEAQTFSMGGDYLFTQYSSRGLSKGAPRPGGGGNAEGWGFLRVDDLHPIGELKGWVES